MSVILENEPIKSSLAERDTRFALPETTPKETPLPPKRKEGRPVTQPKPERRDQPSVEPDTEVEPLPGVCPIRKKLEERIDCLARELKGEIGQDVMIREL